MPDLTWQSDQPVGASSYPQWSFSAKILTPKAMGSFILEILTNRSQRVNLRSLSGPCLEFFVYNETWWPMFNIHLSYKPPSSWRILFRSGGSPRKFSRLKMWSSLLVTSGGYHKGLIIQGGQIMHRFPCVRTVIIDKKRGCNSSVCLCTQT